MTTFTTITLSPEDLETLIETAVTRAIERTKPPENMRLKEAAKYLGISSGTLYNHISSKRIKAERLGTKLWIFRKQDLDDWLGKNG